MEIVQTPTAQIVQSEIGQLPEILLATSYTNHIAILNQCKLAEEKKFYIIYAHRERLKVKEMVAEYKRKLIPKEKMQTLLQEYCDLALLEKKDVNHQ